MGHSGERHPRLVSWATVGKDILGWYNGSQWRKDRILMARETQQERQTPARKQIGKWKLRDMSVGIRYCRSYSGLRLGRFPLHCVRICNVSRNSSSTSFRAQALSWVFVPLSERRPCDGYLYLFHEL